MIVNFFSHKIIKAVFIFSDEGIATNSELLIRIIWVGLIIIGASLIYLAYHHWVVPKHIKEAEEYKKDRYKNIDGC